MMDRSSQGMSKFKSTCEDLWLLGKQAWYVPFLWSLAWFSYWVFYDVIVLNLLTEGTPSNFLGVSISISGLLVAGYISGKSITQRVVEKAGGVVLMLNKKFSFRKTFETEKNERRNLPWKLGQEIRAKNTGQRRPEVEWGELVENGSSRAQEISEMPDESVQLPTSRALSNAICQSDQAQEVQEISSVCLVCPSLLSCNGRQYRKDESMTSCPFAKGSHAKVFFESE